MTSQKVININSVILLVEVMVSAKEKRQPFTADIQFAVSIHKAQDAASTRYE
jgi:hypothetical protein